MKTLITLLLLIFWVQSASTQTSLGGKITDSATGEPILFAAVALYKSGVLIAGTETDFDGNYSFTEIDPGAYDVEVSYVGYEKQRIEGVSVLAGKINRLDIQMSTGITLQEVMVVEYRVPLIQQDNTTSGSVVTSDRIRSLRTRKVNGQAAATAGASKKNRGSKVNVRGSRSTAAEYYIDGVRVKGNAGPQKAKARESEPPSSDDEFSSFAENSFIHPSEQAFSTFSIDVDRASYSVVRRMLNNNRLPPPDAVRTEEMVNYFAYDYPQPSGEVPFAIHTEVGESPWDRSRLLLHIGLQGQNLNLHEAPANNLVFLIDVSGSMSSEDRLPLVKKAFRHLIEQLRSQDRVAIVVYAGAAGLALPSTPGDDKQAILQALDALQSGGSTAGGAGIQLAYQSALDNFIAGGNNRVILATDGDFNVGTKSLNELERLIEHKRKDGVYLTCLGFGMGNYKDNRLELLADKGNGNYAYIDNLMEARKVFGTELTGTLYTIAKDVKIQIEFNPLAVDSFRLIGYENRLLSKEDFDDDAKDAGELGAGHSVTALYEIIPRQSDAAQLAKIQLRYKLPDKKQSRLIEAAPLAETVKLEATSDNFRFAAAVAAFSLILRKSKYAADMTFEQVAALAESAQGADTYAYRREFVELVKLAQDISEENEQ